VRRLSPLFLCTELGPNHNFSLDPRLDCMLAHMKRIVLPTPCKKMTTLNVLCRSDELNSITQTMVTFYIFQFNAFIRCGISAPI
jgi:hypothetical protein